MIRNFKGLAPALVAVLAMSAMVATAAQAAPEFTGSGTATGSNTAGSETFTTPAGTVQCRSHFVVEKVGGGELGGSAAQVTVKPSYDSCVAFGFINADVHENGCDYVFTATEKVATDVYNHHVRLDCPGTGGGMMVTGGTCEAKIPEEGNSSLTWLKTTNLVGGTVTVQPNLVNITFIFLKDGFACPATGTGHTLGAYHGDVTIARVGGGSIPVSG